MAVKIVSVSPCDGWYYVGRGVRGEAIVFKVAAWGVTSDGLVHGLVAVSINENEAPRLVIPPPIGGTYKTREHLTKDEADAAAKP